MFEHAYQIWNKNNYGCKFYDFERVSVFKNRIYSVLPPPTKEAYIFYSTQAHVLFYFTQ